MKNLIGLLIIVILIYGCNDSSKPDENPMVTIEISQNG